MNRTQKLTLSAMVIALYVIIMYVTQGFAFGQYQVRIATSLYGLGYLFPFLIVPLGVANLISNTLMGGLGILDMLGGAIVGLITTSLIVLVKKIKLPKLLIILPIALIPTLLVPMWLSFLIHVPYIILVISLFLGQVISGIVGYILVRTLERIKK